MIEALQDSGLEVRDILRPNARNSENLPYNKHIIRLSTPQNIELLNNGSALEIPEVVIVNNNNNRGSIQIMLGIYRFICSNGMIVGDQFFNQKVRHDSNILDNLFSTLQTAREKLPMVAELVDQLKAIELGHNTSIDFKDFIHQEVIAPRLSNKNTTKIVLSNMYAQRQGDQKSDAWTTFNRFQEYALNGGINYRRYDRVDGKIKLTRNTTRKITGADSQVKLNKELFDATLNYFRISA